jgi:hypothetical protein
MRAENYVDALSLLDRAVALLRTHEMESRLETLYRLRRLREAFDAWRVQLGQPPPELQRN